MGGQNLQRRWVRTTGIKCQNHQRPQADLTRNEVHTIALDAATATGPKQYNWGKKVRLQLTRSELPIVTAVLLGVMKRCEFKNHGQDNSKGFSMERQDGGKVFIKVFAKDEGVKAVPVEAPVLALMEN